MVTVSSSIRNVTGVRIGHATDRAGKTGCTVIAFDAPALTAAEVRGAAPGTRELDLLAPGRTVQRTDAILLTGGSAFGLRAADGVVQELAKRGRGYPTPAGPVPIVPAAVIFDLANGPAVVPTADDGARAYREAGSLSQIETGAVGAGTGARWGTMAGQGAARDGGFGMAQIDVLDGTVTALAIVNAFGIVAPQTDPRPSFLEGALAPPPFGQATTLMAVITDIACDHGALTYLCVAMHDALARVVWPSHTVVDGDVAFASTTNAGATGPGTLLPLALAAELAMEAAIRRAAGVGLPGPPG